MYDPTPEPRSRASFWPEAAPSCWCISDGRPGNEIQGLGLAAAMGLTPSIKRIDLKPLWRVTTPFVTAFKRSAFRAESDDLSPPWPDILIASGRASTLASLYVKEQSGGKTFTVQVHDPFVFRNKFDRVIVPAHDRLRGSNIISTACSLHTITPAVLAEAHRKWRPHFGSLPRPILSVLLGGNNARYRLGVEEAKVLGRQLREVAQQGHFILVTGSRRTGVENLAALEAELKGCPALVFDGDGDNPYLGILAYGDAFLVTCDSVNMISEACSTGKPVHVARLPLRKRNAGKFAAFHKSMVTSGRIRFFEGVVKHWRYEPLQETSRIARLLRDAYLTAASDAKKAA